MRSSIYYDLANRLLRYSKKCLTEKTDPDFADAVYTAAMFFNDKVVFYPQVSGITPTVIREGGDSIDNGQTDPDPDDGRQAEEPIASK